MRRREAKAGVALRAGEVSEEVDRFDLLPDVERMSLELHNVLARYEESPGLCGLRVDVQPPPATGEIYALSVDLRLPQLGRLYRQPDTRRVEIF